MKTELKEITIRELTNDYIDNGAAGITGFGGALDIRPPYQREFIYNPKQRNAVIESVTNSLPLNVMYWAVRDDGTFEVIDGQQRTLSICQYVSDMFSFNDKLFSNLPRDQRDQILDYKLMIYQCTGEPSEKLAWFETINIAGAVLTPQELRNASYAGPWTADAKRYFSKAGCPAYTIGSSYLSGAPLRQDYLETAIKWISDDKVVAYMAKHQVDQNAGALWRYFQAVIAWVQTTFPVVRKGMRSVDWGKLYNAYKDVSYDTDALEARTKELIQNSDVTKNSGIYAYLLTGDDRHLQIRAFDDQCKQQAYERQGGICPVCKQHFEIGKMEADHITPWHEGGRTYEGNCQMLCKDDNRRKAGK